ncbi:toxin-activating lysine-acyltransferase [Agrobacterium sp. NPDC090283]|uniref:toxin-activating lysine-acyltransferase n=1 Tax=Agrobacterium sp. NPDC090283 TaxID=3363920 RepID=UPI00383B5C70
MRFDRHSIEGATMSESDKANATAAELYKTNEPDENETGGDVPSQERALDPAMIAQVSEFRTRIQASFGEVVLAMLNLPRYRHQSLADLTHLVVEPLTRDRIAIARSGGEGKIEETAGIAIWASVSDEVDAKIREQIQARLFPVRLKGEDWNSGDIHWLLDVIAPSQKVATAVLANFKQVVKDRPVRIHPIVAQLVDPEVLDRMRVSTQQETARTSD